MNITNNGPQADRENQHLYMLVAHSSWWNGMKFASLADAVSKARKARSMGDTCDIRNLVTGETLNF